MKTSRPSSRFVVAVALHNLDGEGQEQLLNGVELDHQKAVGGLSGAEGERWDSG
jgi:hypothetical protein